MLPENKFLSLCPRCGKDMLGKERIKLPLLGDVRTLPMSVDECLQLRKHPYRDYCSQECANSDRDDGFGVVQQKYEPKSILSTEEMLAHIFEQIRNGLLKRPPP